LVEPVAGFAALIGLWPKGGSCGFAADYVPSQKLFSNGSPLIRDPLCSAKRLHSSYDLHRLSVVVSLDKFGFLESKSRDPQDLLNFEVMDDGTLDPKTGSELTSTTVALARSPSSGGERIGRPLSAVQRESRLGQSGGLGGRDRKVERCADGRMKCRAVLGVAFLSVPSSWVCRDRTSALHNQRMQRTILLTRSVVRGAALQQSLYLRRNF